MIYNHQSMKQSFLLWIGPKNPRLIMGCGSHQLPCPIGHLWSVMLLTSFNPPVDPDLHLKEPIFQMWTFDEEDGDQNCPFFTRGVTPSSMATPFIWCCSLWDQRLRVSHLVNHLGLTENVLVLDGLNDLELFDYAGISIHGEDLPQSYKKKLIISLRI